MNFAYRAGEINEYIINIRRHIHAHPELSFNERKTTAYIADKLEEMGVEVQRFDDYTGLHRHHTRQERGKDRAVAGGYRRTADKRMQRG